MLRRLFSRVAVPRRPQTRTLRAAAVNSTDTLWSWDQSPQLCALVIDPITARQSDIGPSNVVSFLRENLGMKVIGVDPSGLAGSEYLARIGTEPIDADNKAILRSVDMCISFSLHAGRAEISRLYPRQVPLSISLDVRECGDSDGQLQPWVAYALEKVFEGSFYVIHRHRLACTVVRGADSPFANEARSVEHLPRNGGIQQAPAPAAAIAQDISGRLPHGFSPAATLTTQGWSSAVWRAPVLHDLLVHRAPSPTTVQALLHVEGRSVATIRSDGMCFATPSGSSGYARTLGASAVDAGMSAVQICPINPNSLAFRPMVLPGQTKLAFTFQSKRPDRRLTFTLDGRPAELYTGDCLLLDAAPPMPYIRMLRLEGMGQNEPRPR